MVFLATPHHTRSWLPIKLGPACSKPPLPFFSAPFTLKHMGLLRGGEGGTDSSRSLPSFTSAVGWLTSHLPVNDREVESTKSVAVLLSSQQTNLHSNEVP